MCLSKSLDSSQIILLVQHMTPILSEGVSDSSSKPGSHWARGTWHPWWQEEQPEWWSHWCQQQEWGKEIKTTKGRQNKLCTKSYTTASNKRWENIPHHLNSSSRCPSVYVQRAMEAIMPLISAGSSSFKKAASMAIWEGSVTHLMILTHGLKTSGQYDIKGSRSDLSTGMCQVCDDVMLGL